MALQQATRCVGQTCRMQGSGPHARKSVMLQEWPVCGTPFGTARPVARRQRAQQLQRCSAKDGGKEGDAEKAGSSIAEAGKDLLRVGLPDDDLPPWLRKEKMQKLAEAEGFELPFGLFLVASALVAIAAVGSVFELINQNPIFGVVFPGSPLYTPILGLFSVTGFPMAGFLFLKGVKGANDLSARIDKIDGNER